jgi:hypothetical protein
MSVPKSHARKTVRATYVSVQSIPARTQRRVTSRDRTCIHVSYPKLGRCITHCSPSVPWCVGLKCRRSAAASCVVGGVNLDRTVNDSKYSENPTHWKVTYRSLLLEYRRWDSQFHPGFPNFSIANTKRNAINNGGYALDEGMVPSKTLISVHFFPCRCRTAKRPCEL